LELDVYTLMYGIFAALGLASAYVVVGQRIRHLMHFGNKASNTGHAEAAH